MVNGFRLLAEPDRRVERPVRLELGCPVSLEAGTDVELLPLNLRLA